jgi:4'-phosphopantetheinyl transferase
VAANPSLHFSLSHSRDLVAYALSASPVGIDVEAPQGDDMPDVVAQFHPAEITAIGSLPPSRRAGATLQCWVRKEAYLKAIGTGIAWGLGTTYAGLGERYLPTGQSPGTPQGWSIVDLEAPRGYAGAFAVSTGASSSAITAQTRMLTLPLSCY